MKGQMQLFNIPEKFDAKRKMPLFYVEIIEADGQKYVMWIRKNVYSIAQAKKVSAKLYNLAKGYDIARYVNFEKVERRLEVVKK